MRPGQNRRVRGRNRSKGPNPLTRAFESNGPDVKIRGTAQHVADKYAQLARDAQASGDPVSAENYLQHAEHYYRLIAAAQEQLRQQYPGTYGRQFDEDGEEGDEEGSPANGFGYPGGDEDGEGGYPGQAPTYEGRNGGDNRFSNEGRQAPEPRQNGGQQQQQPRYDNRPNDRGQQRPDRNGYDRNGQNGQGGYDRNAERYDRSQGGQQAQPAQQAQPGQPGQYDRQDNRGDNRGGPRPDDRQGGRDRFGGNNNRDGRRDYNRADRQGGERSYQDRGPGERTPNDRGQGERGQGERSQADRGQGERSHGDRPQGERPPERFNRERPAPAPRQDLADEAHEDAAGAGLPAFLTTPVRAPAVVSHDDGGADAPAAGGYSGESEALPFEDGEAARPRRRRVRRPSTTTGSDEVAAAGPEAPVE